MRRWVDLDPRVDGAGPGKAMRRASPTVTDHCWPEACETRPATPADARVHDAERPRAKQLLGELLGRDVAVGGQTIGERIIAPKVVQIGAHVGEIVVAGYA